MTFSNSKMIRSTHFRIFQCPFLLISFSGIVGLYLFDIVGSFDSFGDTCVYAFIIYSVISIGIIGIFFVSNFFISGTINSGVFCLGFLEIIGFLTLGDTTINFRILVLEFGFGWTWVCFGLVLFLPSPASS